MHIDLDYIYRIYRNIIYGIGFNYFRNETDASNIVQEPFYKLSKIVVEFLKKKK